MAHGNKIVAIDPNLGLIMFCVCFNLVSLQHPICMPIFEVSQSASHFRDFCTNWILPLDKIPIQHRRSICYSKCAKTEQCFFHVYDINSYQCILCLRRNRIQNFGNVGANLTLYTNTIDDSVTIYSRIGLNLDDYLTEECWSKTLGNANPPRFHTVDLTQMHSIEFCLKNERIGGFKVIYDDNTERTYGCNDPIWIYGPLFLSPGDTINKLGISRGLSVFRGVKLYTSLGNEFGPFGHYDTIDVYVQGFNLTTLEITETAAGNYIKSIRARFDDCQ